MKINWKVRLRSAPFWVGAISALLMFLYAGAELLGWSPPFAQEELMRLVMLLLAFLSFIGVTNDPTTPGLEDSARALKYTRPGSKGGAA